MVQEADVVTLSAEASTDSDGSITSYRWVQTSGREVVLTSADSSTATFDAPLTNLTLVLEFEVTVTDDDGATDTATTSVTVNQDPTRPNESPVANAGADQALLEGSAVRLSGLGSVDPDGLIASYLWTQTSGPAVALQQANAEVATFDAPLTDSQVVLTFDLTITDDEGVANTDSTTVTVDPSQPPSVSAGPDQEVVESQTVLLSGTASDADGSIALTEWVQTAGPTVTLTAADTLTPSFDAPAVSTVTQFEFELTAIDNTEDSSSDVITIDVNPNEPPTLATMFPCDGCRFFGDAISVRGTVDSGPDNPFVGGLDDVTSLTVQVGGGAVIPVAPTAGEWIVEDIPLPTDQGNMLTITVVAEDAFEEVSTEILDLQYAPTLTSFLVAHDRVTADVIYIFETANLRQRLLRLDLANDTATRIFEAQDNADNLDLNDPFANAVVSPDNTLLLLNEEYSSQTTSINLSTGAVEEVSGLSAGAGPLLKQPRFMAVDVDDDRMVTLDVDSFTLFGVDIASGNRTVLSDNVSVGTGPAFVNPFAYTAVNSISDTAILQDNGSDFLSVDLSTGNRTEEGIATPVTWLDSDESRSRIVVLSGDSVYTMAVPGLTRQLLSDEPPGSTLEALQPRQITVDAVSDRYVINDYDSGSLGSDDSLRLLSVDPLTGDRSELYSDRFGTGPRLGAGTSLALAEDQVFVSSFQDDQVLRLELSTLSRQIVTDATTGTGAPIDQFRDLTVDSGNNRLLVIDQGATAVIAVDISTGDRSVVSSASVGAGPNFVKPVVIEPDFANNRVFVGDETAETIYSVDLLTGDRTVVSDGSNTGAPLMEALGLALDSANDRLLVTVNGNGSSAEVEIQAIDLSTGDRSTVSGLGLGGVGTGPLLTNLRDIVLLHGGEFAVVNSTESLYRVELATGNRVIFADSYTANGESVLNVFRLAYDPTDNVIYTTSANFEAVFAFDALTGDRVVLGK